MNENKKSPQVGGATSEVTLENDERVEIILNEFFKKLNEAKDIANQLTTTGIIVRDKTRKEIDVYIEELRKKFKSTFGIYPERIVLRAEAENKVLEISLT